MELKQPTEEEERKGNAPLRGEVLPNNRPGDAVAAVEKVEDKEMTVAEKAMKDHFDAIFRADDEAAGPGRSYVNPDL